MSIPDAFADILREPEVRTQRFSDDGTFPNNEDLPVPVFRQAFQHTLRGPDSTMTRVFQAHEWRGCWRNGIFSYHHYHSTAHEVLGVTRGDARIQLGGPEGAAVNVERGDVLVLPAGVAHKNLGAASDFRVVGAYPDGREWDLNRGRPNERPQADRNIEQVPCPSHDPLYGPDGPLRTHWGSTE
ncbi:MAG: cupin domain-containing protein [Salinibacter sp.]|uniref:cupin domain-containing protein n=1 Tax=Salinibacter sp. TaxID=2065818 RepID=UPI0035D4F8BF